MNEGESRNITVKESSPIRLQNDALDNTRKYKGIFLFRKINEIYLYYGPVLKGKSFYG